MNKIFTKGSISLALLAIALVFNVNIIKAQLVPIPTVTYSTPAGALFVAPDGSDTGAGTIGSPYSLSKAISVATTGAVLVLRGGEYRDVSNMPIGTKVTIQAYNGEKPWIKGSKIISTWTQTTNPENGGATIWKYSTNTFTQSGIAPENIDPVYPLADNRDMIYINDVHQKQVSALTWLIPGKFYADTINNVVYIAENPAGKKVEVTKYATPFRVKVSGTEDRFFVPNDLVIKGIGFCHYADGVEFNCYTGLQLINNAFAWNGLEGCKILAPNSLIKGNNFAYNGMQGLAGKNLRTSVVEYNHIYENNYENFINNYSAAGMKIITTPSTLPGDPRQDGVIIRYNLIENTRNYSNGIWLDISCYNNQIIFNTIRANGGFGTFLELSNANTVAANLYDSNSNYAVAIANSDINQIWNNTIIGKGFYVKDDGSRRAPASAPDGVSWITKDNVIKNNIVSSVDRLWMEVLSNPVFMMAASNYNGYYRSSTTVAPVIKWGGTSYNTLSAFKTAVNTGGLTYETLSKAPSPASSNPYFVSATNFNLKSGSVAIGAGAGLPSNIASILGWPVGGTRDIGAYQTNSSLAEPIMGVSDAQETVEAQFAVTSPEVSSTKLYPNPAIENVIVGFNATGNEVVKIVVFDMTSKKVLSYNGTANAGKNAVQLNTNALQAGVYLVVTTINNSKTSQKLLIEN